jgi:hypothetical protein
LAVRTSLRGPQPSRSSVTLPYLEDLTERWSVSGRGRRSIFIGIRRDLSGHMVSAWPRTLVPAARQGAERSRPHADLAIYGSRTPGSRRCGQDRRARWLRQAGQ